MTAMDIRCLRCERGTLVLVGQAGRSVRIDGASVEVPRNFLVPTCDHCGVEQLDDEWRASLKVAVDNARVAALRSVRTETMGIIAAAPPVWPTSFAIGELVAGVLRDRARARRRRHGDRVRSARP